ncbi:hypothetical protein ACLZHR_18845 [Priestia aryabhattai]|uniref:hypothetical protein n=1 Tax=Priestia aryabhattai TaxID=412384 RepID=UPI003A7FB44D
MKKTMLTAGFAALLLVAAGCQDQESASPDAYEDEPVQQEEQTQAEEPAASTNEKEEIPYITPNTSVFVIWWK